MRKYSVIVVGAGIAGSTAALFLARAGHRVTLLERASVLRTSGSPVDLRGDALDAVRSLGLEPELREADTGVRRMRLVDAGGRGIADVRLRRPDSPDIELSRTALGRILADRAAELAELRLGSGPTSITADRTGVEVGLADGRMLAADLLIGADGQHSTVRRLLWRPEEATERPVGLTIATVRAGAVDDPATLLMHNRPGVSLSVHPAGGSAVAAFILRTGRQPAPATAELRAELLTRRYADMGWRAPELLARVRDSDDVYYDTVSRVRTTRWSRATVTLLGDAASSITILGEGSSMAVAGARTLSAALEAGTDLPTALATYERAHRPVVERHQRGARLGAALLVPATRPGLAVRNGAARLAPS
ncbi:FAD-dependent oxidoreductase [Leifsonia shinshuensis]|uniref:FAD-dependent oxidoreductase n=1 Tax=Leifsonia shinshuensis TaxID=150026 RepID=UPI001F50F10D|nr:FAD-dependent oxidoreductase [Leifsonia shinshuensis]MCI0159265.1 FAD-dependent oxidoreductase [Leifsonia shinshuensis]